MKIQISNLQSAVLAPLSPVRQVARSISSKLARSDALTLDTLSIAIVDDTEIARVNWQFLRHRGPTDVITFDYSNGHGKMGEIIISAETAQVQARRHRRPLAEELSRYVIHGLLHLAGYDDKTPAQRREMRIAENELLRSSRPKGNRHG